MRTCHPRKRPHEAGRGCLWVHHDEQNKHQTGPAMRVILAVLGQVALGRAERVDYRRIAGLDDGQAGALPLCPVQRAPPVLRSDEV